MYEEFYQLKADPFRLSPDHRFCFSHVSYEKAKAYMKYALHQAEGFVMITGKPGTGKTTLVNDLLDDLSLANVTVAMLVSTQLEADDLLRMVAFSFGLNGDLSHKATILYKLREFLTRSYQEGRRALLIVDEAQDLSISAMEELRLLTNLQINDRPLLQIFLLGQEELRDLMQEPKMEQGHQRIVAACHLEPLKEQETAAYIRHRLRKVGWKGNPQISTTIFPIIHKFSHGIPRKINLICSRLFLHAFVQKHQRIGVDDIRIILAELQQEQLITSDQSTYSMSEAVDFFDLQDDYTSEVEHAPKSEATVEEIRGPTAPVFHLKAPRSVDTPINKLPTIPEPIEPVDNKTAPTQLPTPENVTLAWPSLALSAANRSTPEKTAIEDDRGTDHRQEVASHLISLDKAPVVPEHPEPIQSETPDPIPVPNVDPSPAASEKKDSPPERALLDSSEKEKFWDSRREPVSAYTGRPAAIHEVTTELVAAKRNRRYWLVILPLAVLLAIGLAIYVKNGASFDSGPLVQKAHQLKTYIFSKLNLQQSAMTSYQDSLAPQINSPGANPKQIASSSLPADHTEPLVSVATSMASDATANDQDQQLDTTPEKAPHSIEQAKYADKIEATDDPGTTTLIAETAALATTEHPVNNHVPESPGSDSNETTPGITTTGNETAPDKVQVRQILFPYKSVIIPPQFKVLLDEVADELNASQYAVARIVGIVDNRGEGSSDSKRSKSIQRANAVTRYLIDRGIAAERLRISEDTNAQEINPESSENETSPRPERVVEVTVLVPPGAAN